MKATEAIPGKPKPYVIKTKKDEDPLVLQWLNLQDVYSDSIRYLIEKEIAENGMRNLQHFIPSKRSIEVLKQQFNTQSNSDQSYKTVQSPDISRTDSQSSQKTINELPLQSTTSVISSVAPEASLPKENRSENSSNTLVAEVHDNASRKPAGKKFGTNVLDSFK